MSDLLALDVAILPPPDVRDLAIGLSASLPAPQRAGALGTPPEADVDGLRLDEEHLPHVTLTQQFVRTVDLDRTFERLDDALRGQRPLTLQVTGGGTTHASTVWIAIERTDALASLHERLMETLRGFEQVGGGAAAFVDGDARTADVVWVAGFRAKSSFLSYTPHITLGHAREPPRIEPFVFEATTVAACHLGRFCTCRRVLREWRLSWSA